MKILARKMGSQLGATQGESVEDSDQEELTDFFSALSDLNFPGCMEESLEDSDRTEAGIPEVLACLSKMLTLYQSFLRVEGRVSSLSSTIILNSEERSLMGQDVRSSHLPGW